MKAEEKAGPMGPPCTGVGAAGGATRRGSGAEQAAVLATPPRTALEPAGTPTKPPRAVVEPTDARQRAAGPEAKPKPTSGAPEPRRRSRRGSGTGRPESLPARIGTADPEAAQTAPQPPRPPSGLVTALAAELTRRADQDRDVTRRARTAPASRRRRDIDECRAGNAEALAVIVRRYGWPTAELVGVPASTAALMILLHAPDADFRLACLDLIARAAADGHCPAVHHAYIADHCAVDLGEPQFYGTRIDPETFRPYPVRCPEGLDERRRDVGLAPLEEQLRTLRLVR
ncbi:hypothetical protein OK074_1057 [Actinobacteria bacterium OK074]|nr:hypothetical protein OK074_1057 [Actinobacteria bacterium OK074]